jgi:rare lipoprotein A
LFCPPSPQNWSRTFTVWIQDIQVNFQPAVCRAIRGGFLRQVRAISKYPSALVAMLFCLHCTRPHTGVPRPAPQAEAVSGSALIASRAAHVEQGLASWYGLGDGFEDRQTASGEPFDGGLMTCAHRTLPFGTLVEVDNLENGSRVLVRVNDRGPFTRGRILDLSPRAARKLGISSSGVAEVILRTARPEGRPVMPDPGPAAAAGFQPMALSCAEALENLVRDLSNPRDSGLDDAVRPGGRAGIGAGSFHGVSDAQLRADDIARHYKDSRYGLLPFIYREP